MSLFSNNATVVPNRKLLRGKASAGRSVFRLQPDIVLVPQCPSLSSFFLFCLSLSQSSPSFVRLAPPLFAMPACLAALTETINIDPSPPPALRSPLLPFPTSSRPSVDSEEGRRANQKGPRSRPSVPVPLALSSSLHCSTDRPEATQKAAWRTGTHLKLVLRMCAALYVACIGFIASRNWD